MSSKRKKDRQVYSEVVITEDGIVTSQKTVYKDASEPDFVKLYIDCICNFKGLRKGLSPIFIALLKYMTYADIEDEYGGQVIAVNSYIKQQIAKSLGYTGIESINKALTDFVKAGLLKRIARGTFQVNPQIVGKGNWKDIKNIRATFDFNTKEIIPDIIREN